jgi:osomolarity two-component system sensor histidine kinase TcsA
VSREECIGQRLLPFMDKQLRPDGSAAICHLTAAIDNAVTSRAERTTEQITTKHTASWRVRVLPIFNKVELVAILLEWHEGSGISTEDEIVRPRYSTDEAFRTFVQAVKDYAIFVLDTQGHIATWNKGAELLKGYTREEVIGQHFFIFYGADDLAIRKPELELILACARAALRTRVGVTRRTVAASGPMS